MSARGCSDARARVDEVLVERARACDLAALAARYGVAKPVRRGREFVALCPFHAEKTPSFAIVADKGFFHCFGCGFHGDAIEFVRRKEGCGFREAVEKIAGEQAPSPRAAAAAARQDTDRADQVARDTARRIARAADIWREARPATGTIVETYLRARAIDVDALGGLPPSLRYHPAARHDATGLDLPCMVAGVQAPDGRLVAIHRTYLTHDGRAKAPVEPAKAMLGPVWQGAIRFTPARPHMIVGEGNETTLTVMAALQNRRGSADQRVAMSDQGGVSFWCAMSLGNLAGGGLGRGDPHPDPAMLDERGRRRRLPARRPDPARPGMILPPIVTRVTILADNDGKDPLNGECLVARAVARGEAEGRRMRVAWPPRGEDFNSWAQRLAQDKTGAAAPIGVSR